MDVMGRRSAVVVAGAWLVVFAPAARGQVVVNPFFSGEPAIFDPEIGTINSGVVNDVQAVVSADRKYVTLTMRPTNSTLVAIQSFAVQTGPMIPGPLGFAGGVVFGEGGGGGDRGGGGASGPGDQLWPSAAGSNSSAGRVPILLRRGMTRLGG